MLLCLALALAGISSCAASATQVATLRQAAYYHPREAIWDAAKAAVLAGYQRLAIDDPAAGVLVTEWQTVEKIIDSQAEGKTQKGALLFRIAVRVVAAGDGWLVSVDGEAAQYRPGMSMLAPFRHGADDEPHWVAGRINAMHGAIGARLPAHQVTSTGAPAPAPAPTPAP